MLQDGQTRFPKSERQGYVVDQDTLCISMTQARTAGRGRRGVGARRARSRPRRLTRAEKQAETRRLLLEAAEEVFRSCGFSGSTVEEISERAGFSRGAFYSNFESKEQLFIELLHKRVYDDFRRMLENTAPTESPRERLVSTAREFARRYERGERWLFELWLECLAYAARHPDFASLPATFWRGNRELTARMIEGTYNAAGIPPPIEPKHLATALTALDIGLAVQNLVDPEEVPLDLYPKLYALLFGPLTPDGDS
jgi:AcrR family transcriptional regulator